MNELTQKSLDSILILFYIHHIFLHTAKVFLFFHFPFRLQSEGALQYPWYQRSNPLCHLFMTGILNKHSLISTLQLGKISLTSFSSNKSKKCPLIILKVSSSVSFQERDIKQFFFINRPEPPSNDSKVKVFSFGHPSIMSPIPVECLRQAFYMNQLLFRILSHVQMSPIH